MIKKRIFELEILAMMVICFANLLLNDYNNAFGGLTLLAATFSVAFYIAFNRKKEDESLAKINHLERQMEHMTWEWDQEKRLYNDNMLKKYYEQKVEWVIGDMDLTSAREIHRPLCGLTEGDAKRIAKLVEEKLDEEQYKDTACAANYHWREEEKVYVIDVSILPKFSLNCMQTEKGD